MGVPLPLTLHPAETNRGEDETGEDGAQRAKRAIKRNSDDPRGGEWKSVGRKRSKFREMCLLPALHPLAEGGNAKRTNRHTNQLLWLQAPTQTQKENS